MNVDLIKAMVARRQLAAKESAANPMSDNHRMCHNAVAAAMAALLKDIIAERETGNGGPRS